jgi:hypothetical protein
MAWGWAAAMLFAEYPAWKGTAGGSEGAWDLFPMGLETFLAVWSIFIPPLDEVGWQGW